MAILTPKKRKKTGMPEWGWRRLIVFPSVAFAFWQLSGLRFAADTRVNDTLAFGWLVFAGILIVFYAGLATAQDIAAILATRSGLPYSPESSPAEPPAEPIEHGDGEPEPGDLPPDERLRRAG